MKNYNILAPFLVLLVFLANIVVAGYNETSRPWHDVFWERTQYPYIAVLSIDYPVYIYFGTVYTPAMEKTIKDLQLDEVVKLKTNGTATQKAIDAKSKADAYLQENDFIKECFGSCYAAREFLSYEAALCITETWRRNYIGWIEQGTTWVSCRLRGPLIELVDLRTKWQEAMDAAMDALEESKKIADGTVSAAEKQYKLLEYAGLCEPAYTYEGASECKKMKTAFGIIQSGQQEAKYGQVNRLKADIVKLNEQLVENANASLYPKIMATIWDDTGIVATFSELEREGGRAKERAEMQYSNYASEADDNRFYAEQSYDRAKKQKPEKIKEAATMQDFEIGRIGTIAERWAALEDKKEEADYRYNNAKNAYGNKVKNYLLTGISGMQKAGQNYILVKNESEKIIEDAEGIVSEKRENASEKIEEAKKLMENLGYGEQQINEKLKDARKAFADGENADALGDKYEYYAKAIYLAAGVAPTKNSDYEKDYVASVAAIEELLKNAEKDGVSVADLKEELEFIKNTRPQNELGLLTEIKEELETRIKNQFYGLQNKRKELIERLYAANAADLINELEGAENGVVGPDGTIDWLSAAGKLRQLKGRYDAIAEKLESDIEKRNDAIANQLITDGSLILGRVKIDQPTQVNYILTITNPKPYEGKEVAVKVPLEGEFRLSYVDIKEGNEDVLAVQTTSKTMTITLKSIDGFERKTIVFEKEAILATTKSQEIKAKGIGAGAAIVNEKTVFQLTANNAQVDTENKTNVLVDGADPNRRLNEGVHALTSEYTNQNAYTEERTTTEITNENGKTKVGYGIIITPSISLEEVPVLAELGESNIVSNVEISCGIHRCIKQQAGRYYIITIQEVKKGGPATVSVSFSINNVSQFVRAEIARYENSTEPQIRQNAQEAKMLLANGDEAGALKKIEEMKKLEASLENERAKLLKSYYERARSIRNEIEDLENAIRKARELGLSTSEISKFATRKDMLNETLEQNAVTDADTKEQMEKKLDGLNAIDTNWLKKEVSAIAKKAAKDFESYKKQLGGMEEAQYQLKAVEDGINVLLATERAADAVQLLYELERLEQLQNSITASKKAELETLEEEFGSLKSAAKELLSGYESEYKDAKSAGQEKLFSLTPEKVKTTLSEIESYIKDGKTEKANYSIKNELREQIETMNETATMLESNALRKISEAERALEAKKSEFSAEQIETINKKIEETKQLLKAKNYIKAMAKASETINYINNLKGNMTTTIYLIAASVLLLAVIAFFLYSKQKKKGAVFKLPLQKGE